MEWSLFFVFNSVLLGVGLAMDAFSVSLANGLNEPAMHKKKMCVIAGTFGFFQALMPMIGWVCVHTIIEYFKMFEKFIPWIALILLLFIGGKMVKEGIQDGAEEVEKAIKRIQIRERNPEKGRQDGTRKFFPKQRMAARYKIVQKGEINRKQ